MKILLHLLSNIERVETFFILPEWFIFGVFLMLLPLFITIQNQ